HLRDALSWGTEPEVRIGHHANAHAVYIGSIVNPDRRQWYIELHHNDAERFESGKGLVPWPQHRPVYAMTILLLHELVHWGRDVGGVDSGANDAGTAEAGEDFESAVYGGMLF